MENNAPVRNNGAREDTRSELSQTVTVSKSIQLNQTKKKSWGLFIIVGLFVLVASASATYIVLHTMHPAEQKTSQAPQPATPTTEKSKEETAPAPSPKNLAASQQDTQRKTDTARLISAINMYSTNNRGKLPTTNEQAALLRDPIMQPFEDPVTKSTYKIVATPPKAGEMQYVTASKCSASNEIVAGTAKEFAVRVLLSNSSFYCDGSK